MALFECGECGTHVPKGTGVCPRCGASRPPNVLAWAGPLLALIGMAIVLAALLPATDPAPPAKHGAQKIQPAPAVSLSAAQLLWEYETDAVLADLKFKNRLVTIRGVVRSIDADFRGEPVVAIDSGDALAPVRARFPKDAWWALEPMRPGREITLTCLGEGRRARIPMLRCLRSA